MEIILKKNKVGLIIGTITKNGKTHPFETNCCFHKENCSDIKRLINEAKDVRITKLIKYLSTVDDRVLAYRW